MAEKQLAYPGGVETWYTPTKPKDALPCPWCGTKPVMQPWHGGGINKKMLQCVSERCEVSPAVTGESAEEAIRKWNRRKTGGKKA